ncbi:zinc finger CCCH domain-containing protein 8 [Tenrec ecaudatus]|uniref:zinc finger CCCH domain-containing protein 8 n=1 Tax=Tenrec ecaudatus TaxID=94439 RepID=UPI003F5AB4F3
MDFENLFSKPPNPALGKKPATDSDERVDDAKGISDIEEVQEEKIKVEYEPVPKKVRHLGHFATLPKSSQHRRKSRSKDYDPYIDDNDTLNQEPEDNFAEELKRYIQAKEMAKASQSPPVPEETVMKEKPKGTQPAVKQKNKNFKAGNKNSKQKKMKRKWTGPGNKAASAVLGKKSQEEAGKPEEKQQCVRMSQGFINQHTVERKGKQICKYFLERKCIKGDQCKFDHDAELEKKKEMCKFYVQGYCNRGENCLYLHNEYPCKFYHTGTKCYQGEHCKFSHAPLTADTQELLTRVLDTEKSSK